MVFKKKNMNMKSLIRSVLRNEIAVSIEKAKKDLAPDTSKLGGNPYLPPEFKWPRFGMDIVDDEPIGRPLSFLCQINLSDVKRYDKEGLLPRSGLLCFFYDMQSECWGFDPADDGCARVFYFENCEGHQLTEVPCDMPEECMVKEYPLHFSSRKSAPSYEELEYYAQEADNADWDDYDDVLENMGIEEDYERSKLLGYADLIQGEMLTECERCSRKLYCGDHESYVNTPQDVKDDIEKHATDWQLLLQLGSISEDGCELMWGDCGNLYFYIRKQDLAERRFDRVWLVLQCY